MVDGYHMPFAPGYHRDLDDVGANQGMPLLVSNRGRSIWSDQPFSFTVHDDQIKLCSTRPGQEFTITGDEAEGGGTLRSAYVGAAARHFPPAGGRPHSLLFTAPQYNLWIETLYWPSQLKVLDYAKSLLAHGFPPGVLMIDDRWHEDYGDWTFHSGRFPDPPGMLHELGEMGFEVMLWLVPYVTADSPVYRELTAKKMLITGPDGRPAIGKWWNGRSAALDLLNPRALRWLTEQLRRLRAMGVAGFKYDGGDAPFYAALGQARPEQYTIAWNRVGLGQDFTEYRDAWLAGGLPLVQRQRDKFHDWGAANGLGSLIPNGIAQGLTGHPFTCPDMIGGGDDAVFPFNGDEGSFDQELFVRYAQCSTLFPMMQFSVAPWRVLDEEHLAYCLEAAKLRARFGQLIDSLADQAAQTGEPIQRSLDYQWPGHGYESITDQFVLGENILVAPVVTKGTRQRTLHLPPGTWQDGNDPQREPIEGPAVIEVDAPVGMLPYFLSTASGTTPCG
ncbi:glycoside hydrolase family 31 protein [Nonomuraea sp. NPDC049714]|uniref:glycoside hydrolase family 31 protein n=1 Tax=Nonomuraea sp. NPDC049714 TaxID=3364357 RepID=UPI0037937803